MIHDSENIYPFLELGRRLRHPDLQESFFCDVVAQQYRENYWFTPFFSNRAIQQLADILNETQLEPFAIATKEQTRKTIAVVSAGVTPLENFYDMFYVLVCGHNYLGRLDNKDQRLLPFLANMLCDIEPSWRHRIAFNTRLVNFDAVLVDCHAENVGLLQQYLQHFPHQLRQPCCSVAVLHGNENQQQLEALAEDIYLYFGRNERAVSHLFVPRNYDFVPLLNALHEVSRPIAEHNQYLNHLDYQKSIRLMNRQYYMDAGTFLFLENKELRPPTSIVNYQYYDHIEEVQQSLLTQKDKIQNIVAEKEANIAGSKAPGTSHLHPLNDYTYHCNTFEFLTNL